MNLQSGSVRWLLGIVAVLLLGTAGYVTLDSITSLKDLEEAWSSVEATLLAQVPCGAAQVPCGAATEEVTEEATEEVTEEATEEATAEVEEPEATPVPESFAVLYPTDEDRLVVSSTDPKVQIQLLNLTDQETTVDVQLIVYAKEPDDALDVELTGQKEDVSLTANEPKNVTLDLEPKDDLPSSGKYKGWLSITIKGADAAKPTSKEISLVIQRPAVSIRHRLSEEDGATIVIGGIRQWPWSCTIEWEKHRLRLWERNLQAEEEYTLLPSELVQDSTGRTGRLVTTPETKGSTVTGISEVSLEVKEVKYPGAYEGVLAITAPNGKESQRINVTAQARDALHWPFLVIFVGALVVGWLQRVGVGDSSKSVPVLRARIARLWRRLDELPACQSDQEGSAQCDEVMEELQEAQAALDIFDVDGAAAHLKQAETTLDNLETASFQLCQAEQWLQNLKNSSEPDKDKVRSAEAALQRARMKFGAGDYAKMREALEAMYAALASKAEDILLDTDEGQIQIEYRVQTPNEKRTRDGPRGSIVLFSDETVVFHVVNAPQQATFDWRIQPWSTDEDPPQSEKKKNQLKLPILADPDLEYPRLYRLHVQWTSGNRSGSFSQDFQVRYPYEILPERAYTHQALPLHLRPVTGQEQPPAPGDVAWQASQRGWLSDIRLPFTPRARGKRHIIARIQVWHQGDKTAVRRAVAARTIQVVTDPVRSASEKVRRQGQLAVVGWALVAGIAGLIYIEARVPTFGSPLDYWLALGWALGLSTVVAPKDRVREAVQKLLKQVSPAESQEDTEKVPDLDGKNKKDAKEEIEKRGFKAEWKPKESQDDWEVKDQDPPARETRPKGSTITVELEAPEPPAEPVVKPDKPIPLVEEVQPNRDDQGRIVLALKGKSFVEGLAVKLWPDHQPERKENVQVEKTNGTEVICSFKPIDAKVKIWRGKVINPDQKESEEFEFSI